jgi:hypothetical protein
MLSVAGAVQADQLLIDFSISAGLYSQLAGVLAGFAFAALVALISGRLTDSSSTVKLAKSYRSLSAAFLGLVATSLNYATVAAGNSNGGQTASLATSSGVAFVVAGIMLVYSISVLLRAVESEEKAGVDARESSDANIRAVTLIDKVLILGACPMALLLYSTGPRYHVRIKYAPSEGLAGVDTFSLISDVLVFVLGLALLWKRSYVVQTVRARSRIGRATFALSEGVLPVAAVTISIFSVIVTSLTVSFTRPGDSASDYVVLAEVIVVMVFALAACVATVSHMTDDQPSPDAHMDRCHAQTGASRTVQHPGGDDLPAPHQRA